MRVPSDGGQRTPPPRPPPHMGQQLPGVKERGKKRGWGRGEGGEGRGEERGGEGREGERGAFSV